jgi:DNA end-binding protein Ku
MATRAIWKGKLKIGTTRVPVELYAAVVDRTVHFHILEEKTMTPVKQHMVNSATGKEVPSEDIRKGYEIEPGTFVVLTEKELARFEPKPSRDIDVTEFVPPDHISQQWYDRPYYLAPDGDANAYFALAEALKKKERIGIARWVMRKNAYLGALCVEGDYLMLVTLRHAEEVVLADDLPEPKGRALEKKELNMAKQLVELLKGEFNPADFKDEYRERVMKFIESKAKGKKPKLRAVRTKRATAALGTALSKSINALKKEKKANKEKAAA